MHDNLFKTFEIVNHYSFLQLNFRRYSRTIRVIVSKNFPPTEEALFRKTRPGFRTLGKFQQGHSKQKTMTQGVRHVIHFGLQLTIQLGHYGTLFKNA